MIIYLLRHGQAEPKADSPDKTDVSRRITQEGARQVRKVSELAKKLGARPDIFVSSPFIRAKQSAEIAREVLNPSAELRIDNSLEPESEPPRVYEYLSSLEKDFGSPLLVTHIPLLGKLVSDLLGCSLNIVTESSSLLRIDSKTHLISPSSGTLVWLLPQLSDAISV
jgi:phosphohistidine phosphatase